MMASSLPASLLHSKNGVKAKPSSHGEVQQTVNTCETLKNQILSYAKLNKNFKFRAINVFWYPMPTGVSHKCSSGIKPNVDEDPSTQDDDLKAARPPDPVILPIWRRCHMGIILEAFSTEAESRDAKLDLAIDLYDDGIHMNHQFGATSKRQVINILRQRNVDADGNVHTDRPIYSAGVKRDIEHDLKLLLDVVESFKTSVYNPASFNCQHFTTIAFYRFTGQYLRDSLRFRWTSNHDGWGLLSRDSSNDEEMEWAKRSKLLVDELHPVEGERYLYSRSPRGFGKATQAGFVAGLGVATGLPYAGAAIIAGSYVADKVPQLRLRLSRSTIWYKYVMETEEWYWTPYRDQEVPEDQRWISIYQYEVPYGPFEGETLRLTNRRIVSLLADKSFDPSGNTREECHICLELKLAKNFTRGSSCPVSHAICLDCFEQLVSCPFCRASL